MWGATVLVFAFGDVAPQLFHLRAMFRSRALLRITRGACFTFACVPQEQQALLLLTQYLLPLFLRGAVHAAIAMSRGGRRFLFYLRSGHLFRRLLLHTREICPSRR